MLISNEVAENNDVKLSVNFNEYCIFISKESKTKYIIRVTKYDQVSYFEVRPTFEAAYSVLESIISNISSPKETAKTDTGVKLTQLEFNF